MMLDTKSEEKSPLAVMEVRKETVKGHFFFLLWVYITLICAKAKIDSLQAV